MATITARTLSNLLVKKASGNLSPLKKGCGIAKNGSTSLFEV
jgi:hypothetical protein